MKVVFVYMIGGFARLVDTGCLLLQRGGFQSLQGELGKLKTASTFYLPCVLLMLPKDRPSTSEGTAMLLRQELIDQFGFRYPWRKGGPEKEGENTITLIRR